MDTIVIDNDILSILPDHQSLITGSLSSMLLYEVKLLQLVFSCAVY